LKKTVIDQYYSFSSLICFVVFVLDRI